MAAKAALYMPHLITIWHRLKSKVLSLPVLAGGKYELPKYVLNAPSNMMTGPKAPNAAPQVELTSSSAAASTRLFSS